MSIPGYTGETKSLRHGHGKFTFEDGRVYEGQWKDDIIEGHGKMIWPKKDWLRNFHAGNKSDDFATSFNLPTCFDYGKLVAFRDNVLDDVDPNDKGFSCEYEGRMERRKETWSGYI